ncbi:MAG: HD domain-containing protein [Nitrospirae bacterium]|nr:HD domain-containing protein [Nitrospirota bacterium]
MIIKTKIIAVIAFTIIITVGITTAVVLRMQNTKMIESKVDDTIFLGDIIERTIAHDMKLGNTQEVQKILENIGKNKEIVHVRILSPAGTILKSTNMSEIGAKSPDYMKIATHEIHQKPVVQNNSTISYFRNIANRQECFACHDSREMIIGVIQVKLDVSRNFSTMLSIKRMLVFSNIIIVIVISVVLSLLFSRFVMTPLKNLLTTIQEVEGGNWNATVQGSSKDELGTIGTAFNRMIDEMNKLYKKNLSKERELSRIRMDLEHKNKVEDLNSQLEFRLKELETANKAITSLSKEVKGKNKELEKVVERLKKMNEVGRILTSIVETEEVMKIITRTTADLFNTERAILHIRNANQPPLIIQYRRGLGTESIVDVPLEYQAYYTEVMAQGKPILLQHGNDPLSKIGVPLKMKGEIIGTMILEMKQNGSAFSDEDMEILTTLSNQAIVSMENAWLYESVKRNYFATIQSLVNALEASDLYSKGHSERVKLLALELGRFIGLDYKELEILEHASILHDIGKIGIESFILQKQGKLTSKEYSLIKSHPLIGEEILSPIDTLEGVRQTIIQHHERYDGAGYPYGLRGEELSLKARILSVVDTFDAMMSERSYRKALSIYQVKEELFLNAGKQFDPYVVESFIEMINLRGESLLSASGYTKIHSIS